VDDYEHVAAELELDVAEVEASVFSHERTSDSSRIYRLKREALEFRRAVFPLREPIARFASGAMPEDTQPYFRDIGDHLSRVAESIDSTDKLLDNALNAHLAQLTLQQNDDMRRLAAGATLFAIPTAIAGIYGMNFVHMPELQWRYGYPLVVAITVIVCWFTYRKFRKSGWL
jgi:magnesium transporter